MVIIECLFLGELFFYIKCFFLSSHFIPAFLLSLSHSLSSIQFSHSNLLSSAFISPFSVEFKLLPLSLSVSVVQLCVQWCEKLLCGEQAGGVISLSDVLISITESCAHSYSQTLLELHLQDRGLTHTRTHECTHTIQLFLNGLP